MTIMSYGALKKSFTLFFSCVMLQHTNSSLSLVLNGSLTILSHATLYFLIRNAVYKIADTAGTCCIKGVLETYTPLVKHLISQAKRVTNLLGSLGN